MEFEIIEKGSTEGIAGNLSCTCYAESGLCGEDCSLYCPGVCIPKCIAVIIPMLAICIGTYCECYEQCQPDCVCY